VSQLTPRELADALPEEREKLIAAKRPSEVLWSRLTRNAFAKDRVQWKRDAPPWWNWLPFVGIITQRSRELLYEDWTELRRWRFRRLRPPRGS
jgi:hypothetical protein